MNLFTDFEARIKTALEQIDLVKEKRSELDFGRIAVEPPRDRAMAMSRPMPRWCWQKPLGTNPRALADVIIAKLKEDPTSPTFRSPVRASSTSALAVGYWQRLLAVDDRGRHRLRPLDARQGRKVNVEYVSANPTGPMHVGHCRGAVVGDALANLLPLPVTT
jgi:arginyl-tRNA synthetase